MFHSVVCKDVADFEMILWLVDWNGRTGSTRSNVLERFNCRTSSADSRAPWAMDEYFGKERTL